MKFFDLQCWSYYVVIILFMQPFCRSVPIPVAARSKAWVFERLLAGVEGSNLSGGMDVYLVSVVCCQVDVSASGRSLVQRRWCGVSHWVWSWSLDNKETLAHLVTSRHGEVGGEGVVWSFFHCSVYSRFTSVSPPFCITACSTSLTNLTVLLPQSRDCRCYVSRRILAPSSLWLQENNGPRAHDFTLSPDLLPQPGLRDITCSWSWRLYGISPAI